MTIKIRGDGLEGDLLKDTGTKLDYLIKPVRIMATPGVKLGDFLYDKGVRLR